MNIEGEGEDFDLAAELGAALDEARPVVEQKDEPVEGETPEEKQERLYKRDGRRFAPVEDNKADKTEKPVKAEEKPAKPTWKPTWYKDEFGPWDQLTEPFRNALRDQERNAAQAIEKHSTAAKAWEPINEALKPMEAQLRAEGMSPQHFVHSLVNTYSYLQQDPVAAINWLVQQRLGTDIYGLAEWMYNNGHKAQHPDPMQQKLAQLEQQIGQLSQLPQQQRREAVAAQISAWAKDKPDFAAVQPLMAALAKQNPQASLDELYEEARWATPQIRERILAEREDKRLAELKGKRAVGAQSPRGAAGNGVQAPSHKTMSLEDEIAMHLDGG